MTRSVLIGLGTLLVVLASVVIVRTVRLSYDLPDIGPVAHHDFDAEAATERLAQSLQFRTVSYQDPADLDADEFEGFIAFLEEAYPRLHETLDRERVGDYTLLYRWDGTDPDRAPAMLMGHYDVVPIEEDTEDEWRYPPFSGTVAEGYVWGRGALDDKGGTLSILEAIEYLLGTGYTPERTVYLSLNHDEEVGGFEGAARVADRLEARGVELDFLVDEGMPVAEEVISGIESPLAMIGVAEKGNLSVELSVTREGGHSSMPPRVTTIGELAAAIRNLKETPMPGRFADLIQYSFEPISVELPFIYRMALANLWLFRPLVESQLSNIPHTNAALRTTIAPTIFHAGLKTNVLPARAEAIINFRIHPNDDVESVVRHVEKAIDNPAVEIRELDGAREASFVSDLQAEPYRQLQHSIWETFGEIPIAPSMFVAATDSRHFHALTHDIYRFRPIRATPDDRKRLHGTDERINVENYAEMIQFQIRLLQNTTL